MVKHKHTWQSNFRRCHGVGHWDVKLHIKLVLLEVDDVPALAKPTGALFVRFQTEPDIKKTL